MLQDVHTYLGSQEAVTLVLHTVVDDTRDLDGSDDGQTFKIPKNTSKDFKCEHIFHF